MAAKRNVKVFHVELNDNNLHPTQENPEGKHFYFGSIPAIITVFNYEIIGVKQKRLYDFNVEPGKPYKNKFCIIRKSEIIRHKGNRNSQSNKSNSVDIN